MQRAYKIILSLYSEEHRAIFGPEMLDNLSRAAADYRNRGPIAVAGFWFREIAGLISGLLSEWNAKRTAGGAYLKTISVSEAEASLPTEIAETRKQLTQTLALMEHAIANHDFPKARFYSDAERLTRAHLNKLQLTAGGS